jgi:HEAT repeat protein
MKKLLIRMFLIATCLVGVSNGSTRSSKAGPDKAVVEREIRQIEQMTADNDIDGLIDMLANGTFPSKIKVTTYLKDAGDERALPELERANKELGGWDLRSPCDDRSGIFAIAIWKISTKELPESEKIGALLELIEGSGPIVPEQKTQNIVVVNGEPKQISRSIRPNYFVGLCAEEELEQFDDAEVTARLRKSENKGIAPYAVWREVRDLPTEAAISRCVEIVHEEGRTQQHGAIHCLERFDHPNAILALDILAGEGYSEAIRALNHFASRPDVFDRLCNHLLHNPYYVVRMFADSPVRYIKNESLRAKSLKTLVRALYDPSEKVRRSVAFHLTNYIYSHNKPQLMIIRDDLLKASEHPDAEVRSYINKALERVGWLDPDVVIEDIPEIRTDIEEQSHPKGSGFDRKERMITLLEAQALESVQKGEDDKANEIYTKLLILDPQNDEYRSHLPDETPRLVIYYAKENELDIGLEKVELSDYEILTEKHIVSYDWDTHTMTLTKEGVQRIPSSSLIGVRGRSFVIVADGQRCYLGAFWSSFSSISCSVPVINIHKPGAPIESGKVQIERAYPTGKFAQGKDPRFDDKIKNVLKETGKLRYSDSEVVSRLSEKEVLRMADEFATKRRAKYETFDLNFYPKRSAKFNAERKSWFVPYIRTPNRWPGDHFSILVDDSTRELKYIGGA